MKKVYLLCLSAMIAVTVSASQSMKIKINRNAKQTEINTASTTSKVHDISQLTGSIICNTPYIADTTMDLNFMLMLTNTDFEYGDSLSITFPAGVVPNSSPTDPIGPDDGGTGSDGPEALNGVNGQVITWGNNDNNYGGIVPGVAYPFVVNVTIDSLATGVLAATFDISGDGFGPSPGDMTGSISLAPLSSNNLKMIAAFAESGCGITFDTIFCMFTNLGSAPATAFDLQYISNGGTPVVEAYSQTANPGDTLVYVFTTLLDASVPGAYNLDILTSISGDGDPTNDTVSYVVNNLSPYDLSSSPQVEDFEAAAIGDVPSGWLAVDVDGAGIPWSTTNTGANGGVNAVRSFEGNTGVVSEDWLFTSCLALDASRNYKLEYWKRMTGNTIYGGDLGVYLCTAQSVDSVAQTLLIDTPVLADNVYYNDTLPFTVATTGTYYIAFKAVNTDAAVSIALRVDDYQLSDAGPVGIKELSRSAISVYPNPSTGVFNVNTVAVASDIYVSNAIGQVVFAQSKLTSGNHAIDLSSFAKGIYSVKVISGNKVDVKKITIN